MLFSSRPSLASIVFIIGGAALINCEAAPAAAEIIEPLQDGHLDLRRDCGARGDGRADDSFALKSCLMRLQAELDRDHPTVLRISAGIYRISGSNGTMPTIVRRGGTILGDGPHTSYILLDEDYVGPLFSWSEAWTQTNFGPPSYNVFKDSTGPTIIGLQITGSTNAKAEQDAFVFYDRNDNVLLRDIEVDYLNGLCLSIGRTLHLPQAYMRESAFYNIKCFSTGTETAPSIEIGSTTAPNSDGTNELDFYKLAIFDAKNQGLVIKNSNNFSATRRTRIFGLRVEKTGGDAVSLGGEADHGQISDIDIYDLTVVQAGRAALRIGASASAPIPYQIDILGGSLGPGNKVGISIEAGTLINIKLNHVDAPIVSGARVSRDVFIRTDHSQD